mmetsp:Transcript_20598/g.57927  ORF Transcript_20598/g.57927 Transcript_20598/m.57927 type:complete len:208 (+) Transcript_20598:167-790(+)
MPHALSSSQALEKKASMRQGQMQALEVGRAQQQSELDCCTNKKPSRCPEASGGVATKQPMGPDSGPHSLSHEEHDLRTRKDLAAIVMVSVQTHETYKCWRKNARAKATRAPPNPEEGSASAWELGSQGGEDHPQNDDEVSQAARAEVVDLTDSLSPRVGPKHRHCRHDDSRKWHGVLVDAYHSNAVSCRNRNSAKERHCEKAVEKQR